MHSPPLFRWNFFRVQVPTPKKADVERSGLLMLLHDSADLLPDVDSTRCMVDVDASRTDSRVSSPDVLRDMPGDTRSFLLPFNNKWRILLGC